MQRGFVIPAIALLLAANLAAQTGPSMPPASGRRQKWFRYQEGLQRMNKPRVIIETDAGGDPDDEQSLVRFLVYSNMFDVEGIIAARPKARPEENVNPVRTGLGIVQQQVKAYGEVRPFLIQNAPGYPTESYLWKRTVADYTRPDVARDLVIKAVDSPDPRPVWFMDWGIDWGSTSSALRRALDQVLLERGPAGYAAFKNKILLSSADRFRDHTTEILPHFRLFVDKEWPTFHGDNWYHRWGPNTATAGGFNLQRDVLTGHGPLGALYPTNTNEPQKEGDTTTYMYVLPTGMNDPMHPEWGSWDGRYAVLHGFYRHIPTYYGPIVEDHWHGTTSLDNTLRRWAVDIQDDFRARMDWCVKPWSECNHQPVAILNGDTTQSILQLNTHVGATVTLSAAGSWDPDGNALNFDWIPYPEAGGYPGTFEPSPRRALATSVTIPEEAAGHDLHVVLAVHDNGSPALVAYRRIILHVASNP